MFEVWKHTEDANGPFVIDYGIISEDALDRVLVTAKENEEVEYRAQKNS